MSVALKRMGINFGLRRKIEPGKYLKTLMVLLHYEPELLNLQGSLSQLNGAVGLFCPVESCVLGGTELRYVWLSPIEILICEPSWVSNTFAFQCPLHGKIIARDEIGNPVNAEDIAALEAEKAKAEEEQPPDWQDPEFLKDIKVFYK